ncbi:DUF1761 domain-containing protein [Mangrovibacillus cuniculi]|uniref:DUF1761 domain-containing protein n=1 Tax=Mangrovibacillus cuniculi TaxID=2593652 RepID=A0A7S8CCU7_9BACI|nr:DUF1761 domain-containing protein [Mangrovibacillus cuniculi]QPC47628.1 DUF1761 domain-containing protein [Mangrovibacillus cuniculi]
MFTLSLTALLVGAFVYMLYGGIYYSILLKNKKNHPVAYVVSIIIAFISSFLVGFLVQAAGVEGIFNGGMIGLIIGFLISLMYVKNTMFKLIERKYFYIAIGDHLVIFTILGAVHGYFM